MSIKKIAILFSGRGSNLLSLLEKLHHKSFNGVKIEVALTISNKKDAGGIIHSRSFGIEPIIIEHKNFSSRQEFDMELVKVIQAKNIDLTILAGFMRILTPVFTTKIKAINLHPSLLPLFKGSNAIEDSYKSDMLVGGVSVHYVSEELDGGKLIAQEAFNKDNMSLEEFEKKIHEIEHDILPRSVIELLCKQK